MPTVELKAPYRKYRVVCVDTFDHNDWITGDYETFKEAQEISAKSGGEMLKTYVYDDKGTCLFDAGTY